ncbi:MAG: FtsW/RodA/SpoVE family cell cycle protein, partial [Chloroflexi bacterium]|nr:FtsW/RodA/SpoVE family cell cycle protein [Chloroflexota bacterium]
MGTRIFREASPVNINHPNPSNRLSDLIAKGPADFPLLMVIIVFIGFGLMMVYSASWDYSFIWYDDAMYQFYRQIIWMAAGIIGATVISFLDYHIWRKLALAAMVFTIFWLIVLVGQRSGRTILDGSYQPSELAKVVSVIYLSVWIHSKREQIHDVRWGIIPLGVIIGIICGLIFLQPDNSAALTVLFLGGLIFFLGGGDIKQIAFLSLMAIIVVILILKISSTGQSRMQEFILGLGDLTKASDHVTFSYRAIINGGWFGVGLGLASTKLIGLPFAPTDSVFAV